MNKPYSYHIFLFPFRWEAENIQAFENKINTNDIWEKDIFTVNIKDAKGHLHYNENVYFYDFVKDAIYNSSEKQKNIAAYKLKAKYKEAKYTITHYRKADKKIISENGKPKEFQYELDIDKIELKIYDSRIGILAFFLENNIENQSSFEHILAINEFGRRIFTPFYTEGFNTIETKKELLAHKISVYINKGRKLKFEHCFGEEIINYEYIPEYLTKLIGNDFIDWNEKTDSGIIKIKSALDDRMFVVSWYGNNDIATQIKSNYKNNKDWYRYLFVDSGNNPSCQNNEMMIDLLNNHTYSRWTDYNTFYGISRYSFTCITKDLENLVENDADFIPIHIKTIYYQMIVLSLMQRASILRFSDEVTEISKLSGEDDIQLKKIKDLNKAYLRFTNQMYFREVTAQEQGIELYDMIQEHMRIERDVKDLNREIDELYQFARLLEDEKERKQMNRMQRWGAVILIPTLIAGIFGMNTMKDSYIALTNNDSTNNFLLSVGFILIIPFLYTIYTSMIFLKKYFKNKN